MKIIKCEYKKQTAKSRKKAKAFCDTNLYLNTPGTHFKNLKVQMGPVYMDTNNLRFKLDIEKGSMESETTIVDCCLMLTNHYLDYCEQNNIEPQKRYYQGFDEGVDGNNKKNDTSILLDMRDISSYKRQLTQ